ncbi:hypothetical protein GP2_031_00320 [Gordonia paraffinivorans NBRC 108238]|uniref:DUF4913 domain-containing protein n=1 Tax=Gordonia paraffinivorans NBRC 108238 TaxID=1223543 RepID=A0ABQ0IP14_9ACTN|nr:DUF4913 domain-containing protein [Gordonia paraffinivorans]GAC85220.1 hypothetical protein GP2_031_00320 [Gordonia paraffinivorans NBRC 108238]
MTDDLFLDEEFDDVDADCDGEAADEAAAPEPEFTSVYEFVETHLVYLYARKVAHKQDRRWCPRWFEHPEAVSRLEALWRAYESLRLDPGTGMSVWWRDHADHHMSALFATDGPFEGCSVDRGHSPDLTAESLPTEEMDDLNLRMAMSTLAPETVS